MGGVIIADPVAAFRSGLAYELTALGHAVQRELPSLLDLTDSDLSSCQSVVAAMDDVETADHLASLADRPSWRKTAAPVLAILRTQSLNQAMRCLIAGAQGVTHRCAPPSKISSFLRALSNGAGLIDPEILHQMASIIAEDGEVTAIIGHEAAWLQKLYDGQSVAAIADDEGYSERWMYHKLRCVYQKLEAADRRVALDVAKSEGIIS